MMRRTTIMKLLFLVLLIVGIAFIAAGCECGKSEQPAQVVAVADEEDDWGDDDYDYDDYEYEPSVVINDGSSSYWYVKYQIDDAHGMSVIKLNTPYFDVGGAISYLNTDDPKYVAFDFFTEVPFETYNSWRN